MRDITVLEHIVDHSPAVAFLWRNLEGWPVEFVSDNVRSFGYDPEAFYSGRVKLAGLVHPDDLERVVGEVQRAGRKGAEETKQEFRVSTRAGAVRWVRVRIWMRRDPQGEITHYQGLVLDITEQRETREALERKVVFATGVSSISARFASAMDIGLAIDAALADLGRMSGASRTYVFLFRPGLCAMDNVHEWCAAGVDPAIGDMQGVPMEAFQWSLAQICAKQTVLIDDVHRLPPEAAPEREVFDAQGIKSLLLMPLLVGETVGGFIGFDDVADARGWGEGELTLLRVTAELIGGALERQRSQASLCISERRFKDFANLSADWFSETDKGLRFIFLSERWQEVTGMPPEHCLGRTAEQIRCSQPEQARGWDHYLERLQKRQPFNDLEMAWYRPDGEELVLSLNGKPIFDDQGEFQGFRCAGMDITETRRMERVVAYQASHDALTELVNRREFQTRLERALTAVRERHVPYALCYLDLDRFKLVNDMAGHPAGDKLLQQLARLLRERIRGRDTLARLGGDEFGLLLENCPLDQALKVAEALVTAVGEFRFPWEGRSYRVGLSIGLTRVSADRDAEALVAQADIACLTAKERGRQRVEVYTEQDAVIENRRHEVLQAAGLQDALDHDRFALYGQPIVALDPDVDPCVHYEILLRLPRPDGEVMVPGAFLPAAERYGLMGAVDRWVIRRALTDGMGLLGSCSHSRIGINLSATSLGDESFLGYVRLQFAECPVPPEAVCFEITETAAIEHLDQAIRFIEAMKALGCRFALDDFGCGVSSFSYLRDLPVDYLKIDGSFVRDIADDSVALAMVEAITRLGQAIGIATIAESAEDTAVVSQLRTIGVDYIQGYAVGRPAPLPPVPISSDR